MTVYSKTPASKLDYTFDWQDADDPWLAVGETITTSDWAISSDSEASPALEEISDSSTSTTTTIWLDNGTAGVRYKVVNSIVTSTGREESKTLYIDVESNLPSP